MLCYNILRHISSTVKMVAYDFKRVFYLICFYQLAAQLYWTEESQYFYLTEFTHKES
jgi:hypothetical protein